MGELYKTFHEEILSILYNLFKRTEAERELPNSFSDASIIPIPEPENCEIRIQADLSYKHRCKNHQQTIIKLNSTMCRQIYTR